MVLDLLKLIPERIVAANIDFYGFINLENVDASVFTILLRLEKISQGTFRKYLHCLTMTTLLAIQWRSIVVLIKQIKNNILINKIRTTIKDSTYLTTYNRKFMMV